MKREPRGRKAKPTTGDDHTIPPVLPLPVVGHLVLDRSLHEENDIRDYVEWQARGEKVLHLERMASERVFDRELVAWDVWTTGDRYWVITNPTNLYSQTYFPSLDYAVSFHVGVTARIYARREAPAPDEQQQRLAAVWRRWIQAAESLDSADEAEEFQAVGMRCRVCLLEFVRAVATESMVPSGEEQPKRADFTRWAELIADAVAPGSRNENVRAYLKSTSKPMWQLANWLTHARGAVRFDAQIALDGTQNVLTSFGAALVRHERGMPDQCPDCASYQLRVEYRPGLNIKPPYLARCMQCGWVQSPAAS